VRAYFITVWLSWALAQLADESGDPRHAAAADKNIDWVLAHVQPSGWTDGINLQGHPTYLHFIAYVIQGALECGILRRREECDPGSGEVCLGFAAKI